jgi:2,4-dienoyl-CoA reductase-like NADH-dependent reductase (Old Yellow Enzyme family)/thioredoxin reductase
MPAAYPNLFKPLKVGTLTFRNRILSGPTMMCQLNPDGSPNSYMIGYYAEKAKGGAAQVTVGDTPVEVRGATLPRTPFLNMQTITGWAHVARAIRQHGAVASIELNHGGRISNSNPVGPVSYEKPNGVQVTGMDEALMNEVADAYAEAARLAKMAGFDMVLLHGAHGWLLSQFLSPKFNTRTDEYGGSLENRAKFPLLVIDRVRKAVGPDFPIEYRVGAELAEGGLTIEDVVAFCLLIEDKVDLIHVSAGMDTDPQLAVKTHPSMFLPHMVNVKYAAEEAESVLASGQADAVAMVRNLIADPTWPSKARAGQDAEIRPCLRCLDCLARMQTTQSFACAVNPRTGFEMRLDMEYCHQPVRKKKVLIVGGGPAGLQAAATAARRGHKVLLAERTDKLGGLLTYADYDPQKQDLKRLKDYLIHRAITSGAEIKLKTVVNPAFVASFKPDALLVAAGSRPRTLPIPGMELARHVMDVYPRPETVGLRVVVLGGGLAGCEAALFLANMGKEVHLVEMQDTLAPDANWMHRTALLQALADTTIQVHTGLRCTAITTTGVEAVDKDGQAVTLPAHSVVYALGMIARHEQADGFRALGIPETRILGYCNKVGQVNEAIFDGYFAAMDL